MNVCSYELCAARPERNGRCYAHQPGFVASCSVGEHCQCYEDGRRCCTCLALRPRSVTFACTVEEIEGNPYANVVPELCQEFGCSDDAEQWCSRCRALFCGEHTLHQCLRGYAEVPDW